MRNIPGMRKRVFEIIQIGNDTDFASRLFDLVMVVMILANIVLSVCLTFRELDHWAPFLLIVETITIVFFTIELVLRLFTADFLYGKGRAGSAVRYLYSWNGIIELLSIVPFYLPFLFPTGIVVFRMFRVVRILRLLRANTYSDALSTILVVLRQKRSQILSSLLIIFLIMLMSSLLMYSFEHAAQPEVFKNAFSGIWWATSTLLTVGYGDIYPVTTGGQIASIIITFLGVGMVAIPTGILSAGFTMHLTDRRMAESGPDIITCCPHCGKDIEN